MRSFVIVVDMQRDFVEASGALPVPDAEAIVAPMQQWLASVRPEDVAGVLLTFDTHEPEAYAVSPEAEQFPIHCDKATPGWQSVLNIAAVDKGIPVYTLDKGVFDMWAEPDLELVTDQGLRIERDLFFGNMVASGIETVTVVGVASDFCVRWAVEGLVARGFRVEVPRALTRGIERAVDGVFEDTRDVAVV
jgi:nicotinamidase-related amidase